MIKIIKSIINIVFIIILILLGGYFILRVTGMVTTYQVKSGSMESNIHVGDYVVALKQSSYKEGDAITYKYNDYYVTHRIIKIEKDKIITKGDANVDADEEISIDQVTGKVIVSGGIINILFNYKLIIVAFMLALYLFSWYLDTIESKEQEEK